MAVVSISEAAKLTGKARSTIQSHIKTGKLSKTTDHNAGVIGIDTSELVRVFGKLNATPLLQDDGVVISQQTTGDTTLLHAEIRRLNDLLAAKQETIDSLNKAMQLIEHKKESEEKTKKGFFARLIGK